MIYTNKRITEHDMDIFISESFATDPGFADIFISKIKELSCKNYAVQSVGLILKHSLL